MANEIEVKIPDIGGSKQVDVIEILVHVGDQITVDTPLITLESEKASMEIPSPFAGKVTKLNLKLGDKVAEGDLILLLEAVDKEEIPDKKQEVPDKKEPQSVELEAKPEVQRVSEQPKEASLAGPPSVETSPVETLASHRSDSTELIAAGPAARRLARELGVKLTEVEGSGRKARITKEDIQNYVKVRLSGQAGSVSLISSPNPVIDFAQFGDIEVKELNKIKKLTGLNVHRSWATIPHVTQFDTADITELEAFRKDQTEHFKEQGYKLTILTFVCAVVSKALAVFPQFNASLDATSTHLIYKKYCNIGIAVETENGLVVPVIRGADKLSLSEIALQMAHLSTKARNKALMPADMSGGCFTISSLGGIGGTSFTPIVNSPEVAILGLSRAEIKPIYEKDALVPRLILPLSLSYDHRVIDGAEAARFTRFIADCLSDIRRILL